MKIEDLIIDPEFADQIPPLDPDEYEKLESNILEEGVVTSAIVVWKGEGIIVDGHHRYKIIKDHPEMDIRYGIYEKEFPDRYAAQAWMCSNQLGRRNLTPEQKKYLIGKQYEAEKASHGGERNLNHDETGRFTTSGQIDHLWSKTRERIANETQTSDAYVKRAEKYAQGVDLADELVPGTRQEILSGAIKPTDKAMSEFLKSDDPDDRRKLIESFHEDKKPSRVPSRKRSEEDDSFEEEVLYDDDEPFEEDTMAPVTHVSLRDAKKVLDAMEHPSGTVSEDYVIFELKDALDSLIFRWNSCIGENPEIAKELSFKKRYDELIEIGLDFFHKSRSGLKY